MTALGRVVRAGVGRRRVQTLVMALTTLTSVTAAILAAGLLVASSAPFDHAFAKQHGSHLSAQFDGAHVTTAQLAATAHAAGVTAAAGPFLTVSAHPQPHSTNGVQEYGFPPLTVVGRTDAGGPVDDVTLLIGHWPTKPGDIVVGNHDFRVRLGMQIEFPYLPGNPVLTVVGTAQSVSQTADAWVTPAQAAALTPPGTAPTYQMLYRFAHADTSAQISADRAAIKSAVAAGALTGAQSYLSVKQVQDANTGAFVPFVVAFGTIGLVMSVLIIGIVVSGAVGAATRRIGVLNALGFTPAQVVRAYVGQALIPAVAGAGLGVLFGNLLAVPILHGAEGTYGTAGLSIPPWVDVAVPAATLAFVVIAAGIPALRAGRLRAAEAIAVGRTPGAGRARGIQRLVGLLPLPRPLSLGLAHPFARPSRSASVLAAVVFGTVSVTFAVGLTLSLNAVQTGRNLDTAGAVVVSSGPQPGDSGGGPVRTVKPGPATGGAPGGAPPDVTADPTAVVAAVKAQPGTQSYYGTVRSQMSVSGLPGSTNVIAYQGDSSWATHQMISGSWPTGPGQAVVSTRFLTAADAHVGDAVTLTDAGRNVSVRIVGEVFQLSQDNDLFTDISSVSSLGVTMQGATYNVQHKPGANLDSYLQSLKSTLHPIGAEADPNSTNQSDVIKTMDALVVTMTLMMLIVAGLGVLNTVVLDTRDRVHDLGVLKALGMTPRQTVATVLASVALVGLVAGVVGVPIGIAVHSYVLPIMGHVAGTNLPGVDLNVYRVPELILLVLGGLVIAIGGALLPAGWAAKTRTATALRTE
jgi:putative ABC transport system permease protein